MTDELKAIVLDLRNDVLNLRSEVIALRSALAGRTGLALKPAEIKGGRVDRDATAAGHLDADAAAAGAGDSDGAAIASDRGSDVDQEN